MTQVMTEVVEDKVNFLLQVWYYQGTAATGAVLGGSVTKQKYLQMKQRSRGKTIENPDPLVTNDTRSFGYDPK